MSQEAPSNNLVPFRRATKARRKARVALIGPSGSGKTYTGLTIARALADGGQVALIDTERGSASVYSDRLEFDVRELEVFSPEDYIAAISAAAGAGYAVLVIDSLSHAWAGRGGVLEMHDTAAKRNPAGSFAAWRDVTPAHNRLIDAILAYPGHVIATMRSKTAYSQERDEKTGRTTVSKLGTEPVQRDGVEYEFDVIGDMTIENDLIVSKSRLSPLAGQIIPKPTEEVGRAILAWLAEGVNVMSAESRTTLDALRTSVSASSEAKAQELYAAAVELVKASGYRSWSEFFDRGTEAQAATVTEVLAPIAKQTRPEPVSA